MTVRYCQARVWATQVSPTPFCAVAETPAEACTEVILSLIGEDDGWHKRMP